MCEKQVMLCINIEKVICTLQLNEKTNRWIKTEGEIECERMGVCADRENHQGSVLHGFSRTVYQLCGFYS